MLGSCYQKIGDLDSSIATYMKVQSSAGAPPSFVVDANVSAGLIAQEVNKLDTARRAFEAALLVRSRAVLLH